MSRRVQLATLCYIQKNGRTLMLHRVKKKRDVHKGKWNGLGGKFEAGETPEACVKREVREESGLSIRSPKMRGILTFPNFTPGKDWVVFVFTASSFTGRLRPTSEGVLEWIPTRNLLKLNLWRGDRTFLPWLKRKKFFSGLFVYRNKKFIRHSVEFYS